VGLAVEMRTGEDTFARHVPQAFEREKTTKPPESVRI